MRADPSPDSLLVAQALMTHFPASLDMEEAFGTVAYKLRNMDADMHSYFQQVIESINESQTCADPIDPDVLLAGPLRGLGLLDEYRRIESLKASDPAGAAEALVGVVEQVEQPGYGPLAGPLRLEGVPLVTERIWSLRVGAPGRSDCRSARELRAGLGRSYVAQVGEGVRERTPAVGGLVRLW